MLLPSCGPATQTDPPVVPQATIGEFAPAKVNLALHVTGRRADGYHLLDSLVVFAGVGDRVTVAPGPLSLTVTGPRANDVPQGEGNLVLRAARLLGAEAAITLEKRLPAAAGIGGGSSDAAATLRALARMTGRDAPGAGLSLGADVPVCLGGRPARMQGIGEKVEPLSGLPNFWLVLANPGVDVPTAAVFAALARRDNAPLPPLPRLADAAALGHWLAAETRNDLEEPARACAPVIADVIDMLAAQPGCRLARMSGSGATCFGLFDGEAAAEAAAQAVQRPGWWIAAAPALREPPAL